MGFTFMSFVNQIILSIQYFLSDWLFSLDRHLEKLREFGDLVMGKVLVHESLPLYLILLFLQIPYPMQISFSFCTCMLVFVLVWLVMNPSMETQNHMCIAQFVRM